MGAVLLQCGCSIDAVWVQVLETAAKEVVKSRKLAQLLHLILRLGNTLNKGTTHGGAYIHKLMAEL